MYIFCIAGLASCRRRPLSSNVRRLIHSMQHLKSLKLPHAALTVITELSQDPSVLEVWLIGSRANAIASESSDSDLLVFSEREPRVSPSRHPEVDVLWVGPVGNLLLEGQAECMALNFSDFKWDRSSPVAANYLGRKSLNHPIGVARDATEPAQARESLCAIRLWPQPIKPT